MPPAWSEKDQRQFDEVKQSYEDRGKPEDAAAEIAGRVVNKRRREEGRTPNRETQGTGNPNTSLEDRSVKELRNRAEELDIVGRSRMNKSQLIAAIRDRNGS